MNESVELLIMARTFWLDDEGTREAPYSTLLTEAVCGGCRAGGAVALASGAREAITLARPSAARLSSRNARVASSSSTTRISRCSSTPAGSTARENLAPTHHHDVCALVAHRRREPA
jgi:hypothetical protein